MYERYCELRDRKGVRDSDVAKACGITPSTFSDWKKGKSAPNADKQRRIAAFFNVSVEYLATGEDAEGPRYYLDDETAEIAQQIFEDKDLRALFDATRGVKPQDLKMVTEMLRRFKETNNE